MLKADRVWAEIDVGVRADVRWRIKCTLTIIRASGLGSWSLKGFIGAKAGVLQEGRR
jgi:hypothetical protein